MPILAGFVFIIQLTFVVHALRTGRPYWWVFIIMGFPVMGCVIYYFLEVFHGSREHRSALKSARKIVKSFQPDADLKRRAGELEICGSVENKIALARECMACGMHEEAAGLYRSCLEGAFANDAAVLFGLAQALVAASDWNGAAQAIDRLKCMEKPPRPMDVRLLEIRVLEGREQTDAALGAYRELVPGFTGFEARYRMGMLLQRLGKHEAAAQVFDEILALNKRTPAALDEEREWVAAARRAITQG